MNNEIASTFDINWYFFDKDHHIISVASAGGNLPKFLNSGINSNDAFHSILLSTPPSFEIERNPVIRNRNIGDEDFYYYTFDELAKRGIYAFDKINPSDRNESRYILVSYPKKFHPGVLVYHLLNHNENIKIPSINKKIIYSDKSNNLSKRTFSAKRMLLIVDQ